MNPECPACGASVGRVIEEVGVYRLIKCEECFLVYSDPMRAGDVSYYEQHLVYGTVDAETVRQHCVSARQMTNLRLLRSVGKGARSLDIGCGFGAFVYVALQQGLDAYGIDFNQTQVETGRKFLDLRERLIVGDIATLGSNPKLQDSFDLITMFEVIEHVEQPRALVRRACSMLKPGGVLAISCPNEARWQPIERVFVDYPPHHLTRWRPEVLQKLLSQEKFVHVRTELDSSFADLVWVSYVNRSARRKLAQPRTQSQAPVISRDHRSLLRRLKLLVFYLFRKCCAPFDLVLRLLGIGTMGMRIVARKVV
jgi:2-polyprenyl-3-methyl-5-hydroxy-6-metoxy-1,4-benzoquinol methylase